MLYRKSKERTLLFSHIIKFALFRFIFFIVSGSPKFCNSSFSWLSHMFIKINSLETLQSYGWWSQQEVTTFILLLSRLAICIIF